LSMRNHVRHARDFASRRRTTPGEKQVSRLYVIESTPSITGAVADHRRATRPFEIALVASQIREAVGGNSSTDYPQLHPPVQDLRDSRGKSVVVAGPQQPAEVHLIAHELNVQLGNVGTTIEYVEAIEPNPVEQVESLRGLANDMQAGAVDLLIIAGGNPVY